MVEKSVEVALPQGVSAQAGEGTLRVTGPLGALEKSFDAKKTSVEVGGGKIVVRTKTGSGRRTWAMANSVAAHARNMIRGVTNGFEKKLSVVFAHFPISVEAKGNEVAIKNFLGEKLARSAEIVGQTKVAVSGQEIAVSGTSKDDVGQTAANIIKATRITRRDIRVFQDGVYHA